MGQTGHMTAARGLRWRMTIPVVALVLAATGCTPTRQAAPAREAAPAQTTVAATDSPSPVAQAQADGLPLRIAVAGDVGTGKPAAWRTAAGMARLEEEGEFAALLLLGDNVYPNGDPDLLQTAVFDPFADVLDDDTLLLPVLGNHDVMADHGDAHAAAIGMPARWYVTDLPGVRVVALDSTQPQDPDQLAWLEETLATPTDSWVIVTMHHPPFSGGAHGPAVEVQETFVPLFERFGVDLVLAGHEHDYQRLAPIEGITYIISGAAAKLRPTTDGPGTEVALSIHHFLDVQVWPDRMLVRAVGQGGRELDTVELQR